MKECKQRRKHLWLGCFLLVLFVVVVFLQHCMGKKVMSADGMAQEGLTVSLNSGFYQETQLVSVKVPQGATVYYTDTCEEPDSVKGTEYSEPILLTATEEETVYVYRFKAYYEDGSASETVNRTFFIGNNVDTRYTTNVLHVAGDPDGLFGYENGIFVAGKTLDDFLEQNPQYANTMEMQGNYSKKGDEAEREVYIEYFTRDGKSILSQECGIRIHGKASRHKNMKSFRLYARKEYDEQNEFKYPVLPKLLSTVDGTMASEHKRLIVRSAGTDNGIAFIRNELVGQLAANAGFLDVMYAEPVCVYLNGMYYGIYWLENDYDAGYFANRYGEYGGEFVVLESADGIKESVEDPAVQVHVEEFNELYTKFSAMDLTIDENYHELEKFLDVQNYLQYYAIEYYVGNTDWPGGNVKAYRYVAPDDEYQEGTVFDGRYRHLLFDTDYALGLYVDFDTNLLEKKMDNQESPLFGAILERQECRDYFTGYVCDLLNGAMSYENAYAVMEEMHNSRKQELHYLLEETELLEEDAVQSYEEYLEEQQKILDYLQVRAEIIYGDIVYQLDYDDESLYDLNVLKCGESDLQINTVYVEEDAFLGSYIGDIPVVITPVMAENETFDYWIVNGEIKEEEKLILTKDDIIRDEEENVIYVEMVVHDVDNPVLQINKIHTAGQNDYVEIINLSDKEVRTRGYYLSDCEDAYKYALPAAVLAPSETKRYYGKNCMDPEVLGQNAMNFNLKEGETLTLTYWGQELETVIIPDLTEKSVYERAGITGKFVEVLEE